jgi:hypothetical protein
MDDPAPQEMNPAKVRLGLVMVSVVVLVAIILFVLIDDALGRAVMFGVALAGFIRAFLLVRALRREAG